MKDKDSDSIPSEYSQTDSNFTLPHNKRRNRKRSSIIKEEYESSQEQQS